MSLYINNQSTKNFIGTNKTSKRSIKQDNLTTLNYATLMVEESQKIIQESRSKISESRQLLSD